MCMKPITGLLLGLLFISCNNKKAEKEQSTDINSPVPDSINIKAEQNFLNPYAPVDISPVDISYFPVDFPKIKMSRGPNAMPLARVIYSRPHLQGRHVFHEVLKYGEPWRLGANEATELELYRDAFIQDKKIKAGRYVLYCIPGQEEWTIVLNGNTHSWGLQPDPSQDVARFNVPVQTVDGSLEYFTIVFLQAGEGTELIMAWDNVEVRLPIRF